MRFKNIAFIAAAAGSLLIAAPAFAQGMMGSYDYGATVDATQTAQDEAAGKAIWERLQAKQASCADLKDEDFDKLGDYYMGLMTGSGHAAMDAMMKSRLGDAGESQMHVVMGKRLSGCDLSAQYPSQGYGYLSMMGGYGWPMMGPGMMGWYGGYSGSGAVGAAVVSWVTTALVWALLLLAIAALAKWISKPKK